MIVEMGTGNTNSMFSNCLGQFGLDLGDGGVLCFDTMLYVLNAWKKNDSDIFYMLISL